MAAIRKASENEIPDDALLRLVLAIAVVALG